MKREPLNKDEAFVEINPEEAKEKFGLSNEDVKFLFSDEKILQTTGIIGRNKYENLISQRQKNINWNICNPGMPPRHLTDEESQQIKDFEKDRFIREQESKAKYDEYAKKIHHNLQNKPETIKGISPNKKVLYIAFKQVFKNLSGEDFIENADTLANIEPIVKYFARDEDFFKCSRLVKKLDNIDLNPSFKKGLLIVGNYGNGKSTIMKCFEIITNHYFKTAIDDKWDNVIEWQYLRFKIANCHDLVSEFEGLSSSDEKNNFIKKYSGFRYSFDDLKKEQISNNYGKKNIIQALFEKRYDQHRTTHGTCNYPEGEAGDLSAAIDEFGVKYGGHIYDRLRQMFNIIEFKGKSFRN